MSRFYKLVLGTIAVCLLGYFAVSVVIVEATKPARAQPPAITSDNVDFSSPPALAEPVVNGPIVVYALKSTDLLNLIPKLKEQFAGKANITLDERTSTLIIRASEEVHTEIRGALNYLNEANVRDPRALSPLAQDPLALNAIEPQESLGNALWSKGLAAEDHQQQIAAAVKELRQAKSDDERIAAKDRLRQLLASAFAADMASRQKQAAEIEARLNKLRNQFQAREELRDEILELQLKALAFDAGGTEALPVVDWLYRSTAESALDPNLPSPRLPASRVDEHDPTPQERTLQEVKQTLPAVVSDLLKLGHWMESSDGRFYVYVNTNHPHGPSVIRVIDSATGKLIATATINSVVGPLGLTDEGVVSQEGGSSPSLRIPMRMLNSSDTGHDPDPNPAGLSAPSSTPSTDTALSVSDAPVSFLSEYNELRSQYQTARSTVATAESEFEARLVEVQKEQPGIGIDDVKKQQPEAWRAVETARADFEDAKRLLETHLKLLDLDRRAATSALEAAKTELERFVKLQQHNAVPASEVGTQRAAVQSAEINLERANTLYDLFQSITGSSVPTPKGPPAADTHSEPTIFEFKKSSEHPTTLEPEQQ